MHNIITKTVKYKREDFTLKVLYFEIFFSHYSEKETQSFIINLKYNKTLFEGNVETKKNKNHFVFDFKFNDSQGFLGTTPPPPCVNLSKLEQLKIFNEALDSLNVKKNILFWDLINDSQKYLINQKYDFDFYLENLKLCYQQNEIKNVLMKFNVEDIIINEDKKENNYSNILDNIGNNPYKFFGINSDETEHNYKSKFYALLILYRLIYDKTKVKILLDDKKIQQLYSSIIKEFQNIKNKTIFIEMIKSNFISFDIINNAFSNLYNKNSEEIFLIISNNIEIIADCCIRENKIINIKDKINQTINIREIINAIKKIFNYQLERKKLFVILGNNIFINILIYLSLDSINSNLNEENGNEPKILELKNTNENSFQNINDEKNDNCQLNQKINELEKALNDKEKELNSEKAKTKDLTEKIKTLEIQLNDEKKYNLEFQKILNEKENYLNKERMKTEDLNEKIKELENNTNINVLNEKLIKLFEEIRQKDNELKEIKSLMPFEISKNEQLMSVIFYSIDQKIHYSIICKNTDKFNILENSLYEKFSEYKEFENYFTVNGMKVNRFKTLEENKIKNGDVIQVFQLDS